jgi:hypothetical protein
MIDSLFHFSSFYFLKAKIWIKVNLAQSHIDNTFRHGTLGKYVNFSKANCSIITNALAQMETASFLRDNFSLSLKKI